MNQWPPHSKIKCFNSDSEEVSISKRSRLDLADTLMLYYYEEHPKTCFIEVSTKSELWRSWNSENIAKVEEHIRYDLEFDGYEVEIERVNKPSKALCRKPFRWKLIISVSIEDDTEQDTSRVSVGSRFKAARSDASVKTIQTQIEKVFGLPRGCVALFTPKNKKSNPKSSIKKLRDRWKNG